MRNRGFLAAAAMSALVALYFALVAGRALLFITADEPVAKAMGVALLVLPAIGVWWLIQEWRLGMWVQRMGSALTDADALPVIEGEHDARGRLTADARERLFAEARRTVESDPHDWTGWFRVGFVYDACGDRSMARTSLRHAATLFRANQRSDR